MKSNKPLLIMVTAILIISACMFLLLNNSVSAQDIPPVPEDEPGDVWQEKDIPEEYQNIRSENNFLEQLAIHQKQVGGQFADVQSTGDEFISVSLNWVDVYNFDAYSSVTISIPDINYSGTVNTDDSGYGSVYLGNYSGLTTGMQVTASGGGATKELIVPDMGVDSVDQDTQVVTGHGPASASVYVYVNGATDEWDNDTVIANGDGDWSADFSASLTAITYVQPSITDADGDEFYSQWSIPSLSATAYDGWMYVYHFTPNASVEITNVDIDSSVTITTDSNGDGGIGWFGPVLTPGSTLTASDGITEKTLVLSDIGTTSVDLDSLVVSGYGPSESSMQICAMENRRYYCEDVTTNSSGDWVVNFSSDVTSIDLIWASHYDSDNDRTNAYWSPPNISYSIDEHILMINGFTPIAHVTIRVDALDYESTTQVDGSGFGYAFVNADVRAGMTIEVTDGTITRELLIVPLGFSQVDYSSNDIVGFGLPATTLKLYIDGIGSVEVLTNTSGKFSVNTASLYGYDLVSATFLMLTYTDMDGDTLYGYYELDQPVLRSPGVDAIVYGGRPTLKWYPVDTATVYDVEMYGLSDELLGAWTKGVGACDPGPYCEYRIPFDLESAYGAYTWQVRARNTDSDLQSSWSETRTFTYTQLARTWQISPASGTITSDTTPTLQWGDIEGATMYLVNFRLPDDTFVRNVLVSDAIYCDGSTCTWNVDPALAQGEFKWHVRAKNGRNFGRWTAYRTITIE